VAEQRFDALVVGSGPAGSVAALVLARGGARVALVDKSGFPRDKACGDLVGPRGVQLLHDLGIDMTRARRAGDMVVVGPTGRTVRLPCFPGVTYPGYAVVSPRTELDALLHDSAVSAGAHSLVARVERPVSRDGLAGFELSSGDVVTADVVIGADGATSRVAAAAGLVDDENVLWGFALRAYVDAEIATPRIFLWEPERWRAFPGYGWAFPGGVDGGANVGLGIGMLADRAGAARVTRDFDAFVAHLDRSGIAGRARAGAAPRRLGGWLKMGMVGTVPARDRVLLVGDAAGLVNPLQGEGISQAMASGRAAAESVLVGPGTAARRYRRFLAESLLPYQSVAAPVHAALLPRPYAVAATGRLLTAPGLGRALAGGWSIFWNDLLDGARPAPSRTVATAALRAGRAITARSRRRRQLMRDLSGGDERTTGVVPCVTARPSMRPPSG
jgi:geranylgeranyl reductase family protein